MGEPPTHTQRGGGEEHGGQRTTSEAREWGEGKERRETENQTARWTRQMSAAQSTDDRAAAHSTSCTDGGTGSRGRATPGVLARALRHLLRLPGAGAVGGEPVLPGTREGGSAWGRGRALGSLLSNRLPSCLRPGQPPLKHSAPLHRRPHQEERPKDGTRERERKGGRAGGTRGPYGDFANPSEPVGPTPRRSRRKKDRQKARLEKKGRERGGGERGTGEERREKKRHRRASRLTLVPGIPAATV